MRPGGQARDAPPALTFGLPGKQRVNSAAAGPDFASFDKALVSNVRISVTLEQFLPPNGGSPLPPRPPFGDDDLPAKEIGEIEPKSLQRLRIERGLGQAGQRVGFEKHRPPVRDDEIGARIAGA